MANLSDLQRNGVAHEAAKGSVKGAHQGPKTESLGFHGELGFWGQPKSFYAGICCGIIFQAALLTFFLSLL